LNKRMKIHILGPSGAGTTTLGKAIAAELVIKHFDSDDFFWAKTKIPFTRKREKDVRIRLLKKALSGYKSWVLRGSMLGWGDFLLPEIDLIIYLYVPKNIREVLKT